MRMKLTIFGLMLILFQSQVFAWQGPFEVGSIETGNSGLLISKIDRSVYGFSSCDGNNWVSITGSADEVDRILSIILVAQTTGKKVKYFVDGCTNGGTGGYIKATRVLLDPTW